MDILKFLKLLLKHKFTLIVIPLTTVIITYFLVRQLPSVYVSRARIATGLVDQSKQVLNIQDFLQESKTNQEFSNLLQTIELKKVYDQVSYKLILHDLTSPRPFRKPSSLMKDLNKDAIRHAIEVYTKKYYANEALVMTDPDQKGLNQVLVSTGYDEVSLKKGMSVYRVNSSDFVDVEFQSENPLLSAYAANQLCAEFIKYYTATLKGNQLKALASLDSLQKEKKAVVDSQVNTLKEYKITNRILDIKEQARILFNQITDFETRYDLVKKDVESFTGALKNIDSKFNPKDRQYLQSTSTKVNQDILATTTQLKTLQNQYLINGSNPNYKQQLDSLKAVLAEQINESTDKYLVNPLASKENLVAQKIGLQVQLDLAKYSVNTFKDEIDKLNKRYDSLVPRGANLDVYNSAIDQANKEYLESLGKFNQARFASDFSVDIKQIEYAVPGPASPSKKVVLVILSGMISFFFCVVTLFLLFFLDDHIRTAQELANKSGLPVLGSIPLMNKAMLDLKKIWNSQETSPGEDEYITWMRSMRFEVDAAMGNKKILAITSMQNGEGKTFVLLGLAYAYARINKKILVIDGSFDKPDISETIRSVYYLEDVFSGKTDLQHFEAEKHITILSNRGNNLSLFEMLDEQAVRNILKRLEEIFDLIIIETCELSQEGKIKEWISVSDHVLAVFESDQNIPVSRKKNIAYLQSLNNKFIGWALNKVKTQKNKRKRLW